MSHPLKAQAYPSRNTTNGLAFKARRVPTTPAPPTTTAPTTGTTSNQGCGPHARSNAYRYNTQVISSHPTAANNPLTAPSNPNSIRLALTSNGLAAPFTYTPQNNTGPVLFRMLSYDYDAKKWKASGDFADSAKYMK